MSIDKDDFLKKTGVNMEEVLHACEKPEYAEENIDTSNSENESQDLDS